LRCHGAANHHLICVHVLVTTGQAPQGVGGWGGGGGDAKNTAGKTSCAGKWCNCSQHRPHSSRALLQCVNTVLVSPSASITACAPISRTRHTHQPLHGLCCLLHHGLHIPRQYRGCLDAGCRCLCCDPHVPCWPAVAATASESGRSTTCDLPEASIHRHLHVSQASNKHLKRPRDRCIESAREHYRYLRISPVIRAIALSCDKMMIEIELNAHIHRRMHRRALPPV
jgi:hypothetical protein